MKIIDISQAMCELTLYKKDEVLNQTYYWLKKDRDVPNIQEVIKQLKKSYFWEGEFQMPDKLDNTHWLSAKISTKLNKYGTPIGAVMIAENITKQKNIEQIAITDKLTGIYNRVKLDSVLEHFVKDEVWESFCIMILDIDKFKLVNDTCGHQVGDITLREFAKVIKEHIRNSDIFGRWGGEEFMIILPNSTLDSGVILAQKLRNAIKEHYFPVIGNKTCSIGVAEHKRQEEMESTIQKADKALYLAKNSGRDKVCSQKDLG